MPMDVPHIPDLDCFQSPQRAGLRCRDTVLHGWARMGSPGEDKRGRGKETRERREEKVIHPRVMPLLCLVRHIPPRTNNSSQPRHPVPLMAFQLFLLES